MELYQRKQRKHTKGNTKEPKETPKEKPNNTQPDSLSKEEVETILKNARTTTQIALESNQ